MKLFYFNFPGRTESIRLLLHHAKVPFQDIRFQFTDWEKLKYSNLFEYHQLPILQLPDGTKLSQSEAILLYLATEY